MPDINTPNYPVTESPRLSPNPKLTTSYEDGGRGTPTIVVTEAKEQPDTTGVSLPEYTGDYEITENGTLETAGKALKEDIVVALPEYQGSYSVTENGTLATKGKVMTSDLVVSVAGDDPLSQAWEAYKKEHSTRWSHAFSGDYGSGQTAFSYIDNFNNFDFSGSENVTNMSFMFSYLNHITSAPLFDTSACRDMSGMFRDCNLLTSVPLFDTSNVTSMSGMFINCKSLTSVPAFNTSNVTSMGNMFRGCILLTSVPLFDTSNVTSMVDMFDFCGSLTSVPAFNASNVTDLTSVFLSCSSLEEIHMFGMKVNFSISSSTKFTREALLEIINNCQDLTGGTAKTLTMGSTNLAKLTEEDKLIATNKNWTLA